MSAPTKEGQYSECLAREKGVNYKFEINSLEPTATFKFDPEGAVIDAPWKKYKASFSSLDHPETTCMWSEIPKDFENRNKILILGFPHCGTTILRAKIGDCSNAVELVNETDYVDAVFASRRNNKKIVAKSTNFLSNAVYRAENNEDNLNIKPFNNKFYHDYHMIFIIRNPYELFGSLSKRFGSSTVRNFGSDDSEIKMRLRQQGLSLDFCKWHSLEAYEKFAKFWMKYRDGKEERYNCIKYEEIFDDDFKILKNLFKKIGLKFRDSLFTKRTGYYCLQDIPILESKNILNFYKENNATPYEDQNVVFRTWQIHQTFEKQIRPDAYKEVHPDLLQQIKGSKIVKELGYSSP